MLQSLEGTKISKTKFLLSHSNSPKATSEWRNCLHNRLQSIDHRFSVVFTIH